MTVTVRAPSTVEDTRFDYEIELLERAMKLTEGEFGSYIMSPAIGMNFPRVLNAAKTNTLPNFFFKTSYSDEYIKGYAYAPFPVDLGMVGYRVCFTSSKNVERMSKVKTLDDLKKFTIGQGRAPQKDRCRFRY